MAIKNLEMYTSGSFSDSTERFVKGYGYPRSAPCFKKNSQGSVEFNIAGLPSDYTRRYIGLLTNGDSTLSSGVAIGYGESYPPLQYYHKYGWSYVSSQSNGGLMRSLCSVRESESESAKWNLRGISLGPGYGDFIPQNVKDALELSVTHKVDTDYDQMVFSFRVSMDALSSLVGGSVSAFNLRLLCGGIFSNVASGAVKSLPFVFCDAGTGIVSQYQNQPPFNINSNGLYYASAEKIYTENGYYDQNIFVGYNRELGDANFEAYDMKLYLSVTLR